MSVPPEPYGQPQQPQPQQRYQQQYPAATPQQPQAQDPYAQQHQHQHHAGPQQPQQAPPPYTQQYPQFQQPPQYQNAPPQPLHFLRPPPPPPPSPPPRPTYSSLPSPAVLLPFGRWLRDRSLRNWITVLFVALVVVPSFALVAFPDLSEAHQSAWVFALYFACAWLLVLWISVRPPMVRPLMLAEVAAIGLVLEAPVAVWLERGLHADTANLFASVFTVGLPEEFAKALPIAVLAYVHRASWASLTPKDYLFLGAVSGLAFGAAEAVLYVTRVIPAELQQYASQGVGPADSPDLVLASITQGSWRFVTDPMSHAVWAGITGYFIGLGVRFTRHRVWLAGFGLVLTAALHGLNDYVAGHIWWILEIVVSVLLFVAYSQAGGVIEQDLSAAERAARAQPPPRTAPAPAPQWNPTTPQWNPAAPQWNPAEGWGRSGLTPPPGRAYPPAAPPYQAPMEGGG